MKRFCRRNVAIGVMLVFAVFFVGYAQAQKRPDLARIIFAGAALKQVVNPASLPDGLSIQRRGFGIVSHARLDGDLNAVLQELQRAMPSKPVAARVYATPDPAFRAYASADGAIFIAAGILQSLESRDELAALIAHEYAHVLLAHSGISKGRQVTRAAQGVGAIYLALRHGQASDADLSNLSSAVVRDVVLHASLVESLQGGMLPARTRQHELDADLLGVDLMVRAGYNPTGMTDFLDKLDTWAVARQTAAKAQEARLIDLGKEMKTQAGKGDLGGAIGVAVGGGVANLFTAGGNVVSRGLSKMRREHIAPEQRIERVRNHIESKYSEVERPEMRPLPWAGTAQVARLFEGIDATHRFVAAVQAGDTASYPGHLRTVRSSAVASTPYTRYAQLLVYPISKSKKDSVRDMNVELARSDSLFASHILALDTLEQVATASEQVAALRVSQQILGDPPELLPYAARIHRRAGDNAAASQAQARCFGQGDTALANACNAQ